VDFGPRYKKCYILRVQGGVQMVSIAVRFRANESPLKLRPQCVTNGREIRSEMV
jgi:hypothetical protein